MNRCPKCNTPMKKEQREFDKGVFVQAEVCPACEDVWIDEKGYDMIYHAFIRKVFRIGGSLAIRLPKELADLIGLEEGSEVQFEIKDGGILIKPYVKGRK